MILNELIRTNESQVAFAIPKNVFFSLRAIDFHRDENKSGNFREVLRCERYVTKMFLI